MLSDTQYHTQIHNWSLHLIDVQTYYFVPYPRGALGIIQYPFPPPAPLPAGSSEIAYAIQGHVFVNDRAGAGTSWGLLSPTICPSFVSILSKLVVHNLVIVIKIK